MISNLRKSVFYLQQHLRDAGDDKRLIKALDLMCEVELENNKES